MCLEHLPLTPGKLTKHGWGNFQIDQKGAFALQQKTVPPDLSEQIGKAVSDVAKTYLKAVHSYEVMAAVWG